MRINEKITSNLEQLKAFVKARRSQGHRIVLCQGHFNVIHPGHLRFLEFAARQGDCLIVALQGVKKIGKIVMDRFFAEMERAHGVASIEYVGFVFIFNDESFEDIIDIVKPAAYVRGEEFAHKAESFKSEIERVEKYGGKVIFSSGDRHYASTDFLEKDFGSLREERMALLAKAIKKQGITRKKLLAYCSKFEKCRLLVVGDTIVDQYVACDALGMSSEAPVLVVRELEHKEFVGGAAIVSRHVKALGAQCSFLSLIGPDEPGRLVTEELEKEGIDSVLMHDRERPTTFKIRYMVGTQKVLRVSRLNDAHLSPALETRALKHIRELAKNADGIIVSDFGYGVITPGVLDQISSISKDTGIKLFGDVQSSSQIGNAAKFKDYFLIKPTEKEARIALDDKYSGLELLGNNLLKRTNAKNLVMTLGGDGFISFKRTDNQYFIKTQHFPALNPSPVDVVGAGDSLLTALAVSICAGANLMEASVIGSLVASIAVGKVGNIPVDVGTIREALKEL